MFAIDHLRRVDPAIAEVLDRELRRQQDGLELIASENVASLAVMEAMGSVLTNKYAEGLPHKRYYGGCEIVDIAEDLANARARELFGAEHANTQPHSGAQANMAVFMAFMQPGDTFLGMNLSHGGHLTHGSPVNFSGKWFTAESYGVDTATGLLDMEHVRARALAVRPRILLAGGSAYARTLDFAAFGAIACEAGAVLMVDMAHIAGLVAAGVHPSPVPHADVVTSTTHKTLRGPRGGIILSRAAHAQALDKAVFPGLQGGPLMHVIAAKAVAFQEALQPGFRAYQEQVVANARVLADTLLERQITLVTGGTDNHLVLVDTRSVGLTGKEAQAVLARIEVTANKNTIPDDPQSPFVTSGLRLGTPAITTRGLGPSAVTLLGEAIADALRHPEEEGVIASCRDRVLGLCRAHPLYPGVFAPAGTGAAL
ncbi:MAG: serine hydroxymethyltransferase [Candidatus Sericytochromatia bacterium]|nr:serine hydroxymethyltransferase [Candidatus Tanganyikabacteria bacterium]